LPLVVLEHNISRKVSRRNEAAGIVFGVKKRENRTDVYYYLRVMIRPGKETLTICWRSSEPIENPHIDLLILGDERTLMKAIVVGNVSTDDISGLETRGDLSKLDTMMALLKE